MFNGSQFMNIERARFLAFAKDLWIYQHCANLFGLFGNLVIVVTLFSAYSMRNVRFNSYRCFHLAELLFNIAYWTEAINNSAFGKSRNKFVIFSHYENAFIKIVAKFVYSCVTYTCMYMAILAGIDRCAALWFPSKYENLRAKRILADIIIFISILIAALVNSWGAFYRWEVTESITTVHNNQTVLLYWVQSYARTGFESDAYELMNLYNGAIRIICCLVIIVSTAFAVVGFKRLEYRKRLTLIDVRFDQSMVVRRGTAVLRRDRADKSLYWLMILIAALGIGQVLPGEFARLIKANYDGRPEYNIETCLATNDEQCLRLTLFTIWLTMFANLLVILMRNTKFYLYMVLHAQMRDEVSKLFTVCCIKSEIHFDGQADHAGPSAMMALSVMKNKQSRENESRPDQHILPDALCFNGPVRWSITAIDQVDTAVGEFRASRESFRSTFYSNSTSNRCRYNRYANFCKPYVDGNMPLRDDAISNTMVPVKQWRPLTSVDYLRDRSGSTGSHRRLNRQLLDSSRTNKQHSIELVQERSRSEDISL